MNYIKHLNAFFTIIRNDSRLSSSHVSLYLALFQYWNYNRFQNPYPVYRDNILQLSKIGSRNTYHKCIKELHEARYIIYHASPSKFLPVKITMTRLDNYFDNKQPYQLDIFSPNNDTDSVSDLSNTSPDIEPHTVPIMGQNIKPNFNKLSETPTHTFNQPIQEIRKNEPGDKGIPSSEGLGVGQPIYHEVKSHFEDYKYPTTEAKKFYSHYKALGWKIQGVAPISDWRSLAEKWMENARRWPTGQQEKTVKDIGKEIQYLFESWKEGKSIMHLIKQEHIDHLKLELTEQHLQLATQERIKQLQSSNQYSSIQLLQDYQSGKQTQQVLRDATNIHSIAIRIALITYFINNKSN
jgi:hypothetical protein